MFYHLAQKGNSYPSYDEQYYRHLKSFGLENAHLTDLFKQREKEWKVMAEDKAILAEAKEFL
jgi:hypothetical protein